MPLGQHRPIIRFHLVIVIFISFACDALHFSRLRTTSKAPLSRLTGVAVHATDK